MHPIETLNFAQFNTTLNEKISAFPTFVDQGLQTPTPEAYAPLPVLARRPPAQRFELARRIPRGTQLDAAPSPPRAEPVLVELRRGVLAAHRQHRQARRLVPRAQVRPGDRDRRGDGARLRDVALDNDGLELAAGAVRSDIAVVVDAEHGLEVGQLVLGDDVEGAGDERAHRERHRDAGMADGDRRDARVFRLDDGFAILAAIVLARKLFGFGNVR